MEYCTDDYTVNVAGVDETYARVDMHCPHVGTKGLNFWQDRCDIRRQDPAHKNTCYPVCKWLSKNKHVHSKTGTITPYIPQITKKRDTKG